jgi:exopolysaccharide biosynthesis polyprenyl glycosylphosphotransferase
MLNALNSPVVRRVNAILNASVVLVVLVGMLIVVNRDHMSHGLGGFLEMRVTVKNLLIGVVCLSGGAIVFQMFGLAGGPYDLPLRTELVRVAKACAITGLLALFFPLTSHTDAFNAQVVLSFLPVATIACLCGRLATRACAERLATTLHGQREVIVVGSGARAAKLYERIQNSKYQSFRVLGFVESPECDAPNAEIKGHIVGALSDLERILMTQPVDEVIIALHAESCHAQIQNVITTCERAGIEAKYSFSDIFDLEVAKPRFEPGEQAPVVSLKMVQDDARMAVKRAIDIVGAVIGLLVLSPLLVVTAIGIKLTSHGPVFFVQERYGLRKRRFRMFKFRTMVANAESLQPSLEAQNEVVGPAFKMRNDPRITPLGSLLRRTSIDELPQFFNVLRGEMSLVGPRPLPLRDVSRFNQASLMRRFSVKPGLTCLWQINGRSDLDFARWIELDLRYIDNWSLGLDFEILVKTVPTVLAGRGAV